MRTHSLEEGQNGVVPSDTGAGGGSVPPGDGVPVSGAPGGVFPGRSGLGGDVPPIWCMDCRENLVVIGCANGRLEFWEGSSGSFKVSPFLVLISKIRSGFSSA